jgi:prolyl-tRNA synthetase
MGGTKSVEFVVRSPAGEDWIVTCPRCDYRANLERAVSAPAPIRDPAGESKLEQFPTPGVKTIADLAKGFPDIAPAERQIKTLVYLLDDVVTLVLVRGDHDLLEQKLVDATGAAKLRPATPAEIRAALGADPGSLGAVNVSEYPIIADNELSGRSHLVTGANQDDFHYRGVDVGRDVAVGKWASLRTTRAGEPCIRCGSSLEIWKGIEVGHIFKLGTRYSEVMGALVQDEDGRSHPIVMGSYGIGLERAMAAVVEANHDERGIIWPSSVAPYQVVLTVLRVDDPDTMTAGERLYASLLERGVDVILDDRDERPGVKFADAELIGIPFRVTVGPKGLAAGKAELTTRRGLSTEEVDLAALGGRLDHLLS